MAQTKHHSYWFACFIHYPNESIPNNSWPANCIIDQEGKFLDVYEAEQTFNRVFMKEKGYKHEACCMTTFTKLSKAHFEYIKNHLGPRGQGEIHLLEVGTIQMNSSASQ